MLRRLVTAKLSDTYHSRMQLLFSRNRGCKGGAQPPRILADQLTLSQIVGGGRLCLTNYYLPLQLFRPSDIPAIRGHSTTTWTKFYPILTLCLPPSSGQLWAFYMILNLCHVTKRGLSTDTLPPTSCPRSF